MGKVYGSRFKNTVILKIVYKSRFKNTVISKIAFIIITQERSCDSDSNIFAVGTEKSGHTTTPLRSTRIGR